MANLLSGGVVSGLIGASAAMKNAGTANSVYVYAKATKDESMMQRALGRMTENLNDAAKATEKSKNALAENVKAARKQEKAEQEARLEKARAEPAEFTAEMQTNITEANNKIIYPVDTVEISAQAGEADVQLAAPM